MSHKDLASYITSSDFDAGKLKAYKLDMRFQVDKLVQSDLNGDGLPDFTEVQGDVTQGGESIGRLKGTFQGAPVMLGLPQELAHNTFDIPAGTALPAWMGQVTYELPWGRMDTVETLWAFPSDLKNPQSPLVVLCVASIQGGTGAFDDVVHGKLITHDSLGGAGALQCTLYSDKQLALPN